MLMPKKNRMLVYEQLFRDGVIVAEKDCIHHLKQHKYVDVPNIHVIMTLKSLRSRNYVKEQFAWHHYYWYLTNEGIQYLREVLHLPAEIVPATLKRSARAPSDVRGSRRGAGGDEQAEGGPRAQQGDREAYRRSDKTKDVGAGATENISFRGGFGRGSGGRPAAAEARPGAE